MSDAFYTAWMEVLPDFSGFRGKFQSELNGVVGVSGDRAGKDLGDKTGKGMKGGLLAAAGRMAGPLAAAFAGLQIGQAIGRTIADGISQASDLNEAGAAIGQVFGDQAKAVQDFAKQGATAFGENEINVLRAAQSFGTYGKAAGLAGQDLSSFSTDLVGLGVDMASFFNTDTQTAMDAIASGLRGEAEPLRQFGVLLDDATLKQRAMQMGIYDGNGALTSQQKVLAAQAEIFAQTSDAQGDFERTSGGLANQQRILAAGWDNVVTKIGQLFLPAVTGIVSFLNTAVIPALSAFFGALNGEGGGGAIGSIFGIIGELLKPIGAVLAELGPQFLDLFMNASPLMILLKALQPVLPIIVDALSQLAAVIGGALGAVLQALMPIITQLVTILSGIFSQVLQALMPIIMMVAELFAQIVQALMPLITAIMQLVTPLIGLLMPILQALMPIIQMIIDLFIAILTPVMELVGVILDALMPVIQGLIDILTGLINFVVGVFTGDWEMAWNGVSQMFQGAIDTIVGIWNGLLSILGGIGDFIASIFSGVGDWLVDAGQSLIQGFIDGISSMVGAVGDAIGGIMDWVGGFFPHSPAKRGPFSGSGWTAVADGGRALATQFTDGFDDGMGGFGTPGALGPGGSPLAPRVSIPAPGSLAEFDQTARPGGAGRGDGIYVGQINNPVPEPATTSIRRLQAKRAYLGQDGLDELEVAGA